MPMRATGQVPGPARRLVRRRARTNVGAGLVPKEGRAARWPSSTHTGYLERPDTPPLSLLRPPRAAEHSNERNFSRSPSLLSRISLSQSIAWQETEAYQLGKNACDAEDGHQCLPLKPEQLHRDASDSGRMRDGSLRREINRHETPRSSLFVTGGYSGPSSSSSPPTFYSIFAVPPIPATSMNPLLLSLSLSLPSLSFHFQHH